MKKHLCMLLCLLMLPLCALAQDAQTPYYIDAKDAGGVHLRAEPSGEARSLGVYFTGTPVEYHPSYFRTAWSRVSIGAVEGYVPRDHLTTEAPASAARAAVVKPADDSAGLPLLGKPSGQAETLGQYEAGAAVLVLGETADGWSYVQAGTLWGYMAADGLSAP